jgi:hypothetical protein
MSGEKIMRAVLVIIAYILLSTPSWGEPVEATPKDLYEFGWEYVGETVSIYGIPTKLYACRRLSNKGSVCFRTKSNNITYTIALFRKGITSRQIKRFEDRCSLMTGVVEERDYQVNGAVSKIPILIVDEISKASCKEVNLVTCSPYSPIEIENKKDCAGLF